MDILSEVLNVVRLNGGAFFTDEFRSPWAVYTPSAEEVARILDTPAESVAVFHVFVEGECWISPEVTEPFALTAGSAIIFSHSPSHQLASGQGMTPEPIVPLVRSSETNWLPIINHGGGGPITRLFCGYLQCDHRFNPLVGALPALIIATPDGRNGGAGSAGSGMKEPVQTAHQAGGPPCCVAVPAGDDRLRRMLDHLVDEAFENRPGAPAMLPRLIELFYVEVLRRYITAASLTGKGWFAAMNDEIVDRALRALHAEVAQK